MARRPQALLVDTEEVSLWLGANVMLQYSLDEARPGAGLRLRTRAAAQRRMHRELAVLCARPHTRRASPSRDFTHAGRSGSTSSVTRFAFPRLRRASQAQTLLSENHSSCAEQLEQLKAELATVRDSVTILEVSIARVFNWDVSRKRAAGAGKLAEGGAAAAVEPAGAE